MPKLISQKNLGYPAQNGLLLSSSTVGVLSWTDEGGSGSIGISSAGTSIVDPATTLDFRNRVEVDEQPNAGIASVVITTDPLTIANL